MKFVVWIISGLAALAVLLVAGSQILFKLNTKSADPFVPTEEEISTLNFFSQPESWFLENLAGPRITVDGQTLDPKYQYMIEQAGEEPAWMGALHAYMFSTPWGRNYVRSGVDRSWLLFGKATEPMASIEDRTVDGRGGAIPVRIYTPVTEEDTPLPVLVYHHGGGWIFASIASTDRVAPFIANEADAIVISVGYRLAPEHPYPAASDDGEDVFLWAAANAQDFGGDPARVGVGGDSAGGHVSINIAQRRLAEGGPAPKALLLFYPGAGFPQQDPAYTLFGKGYGLDASFIEFILPRVFPGYSIDKADQRDGFMDPANRAESFAGFPPAIIATAGFDILRDTGRQLAERLEADGVAATYTNYPSLTHSFLQHSGVIKDAETATAENAQRFGELIRR